MAATDRPRVLVLSRVVLDEIVATDGLRTVLGGSGFWAAYGAATVTDGVVLASRVGPDFGAHLEALGSLGISASGLVPSPHPTSRTRVTYPHAQERHEEFVGGWESHVRMRADLGDLDERDRSAAGIYVFRDLPPGFWDPVLARVRAGAALMWEIPAAVCARGLDDDVRTVLESTSILSLNEAEALDLVGPGTLETTLARLLALGPRVVALRRGPEGSSIATGGGIVSATAVPAIAVVDPTGAGNAYSGALLAALLEGQPVERAIRTATAAAATAITQVGSPPDLATARAAAATYAEAVSVRMSPHDPRRTERP